MGTYLESSTCRIQFIQNDQPKSEKHFSERSLVELRQLESGQFSVRSIDIENNREIIFNIILKQENQYKRGKSNANPDEVRVKDGSYRLWLNATSRNKFHEALQLAFQEIAFLNPDSFNDPTTPSDNEPDSNTHDDYQDKNADRRCSDQDQKPNSRSNFQDQNSNRRFDDQDQKLTHRPGFKDQTSDRRFSDQDQRPTHRPDFQDQTSNRRFDNEDQKPNVRPGFKDQNSDRRYSNHEQSPNRRPNVRDQKPDQQYDDQESNQKDILVDVYQLGKNIRDGNVDTAINIAKKLAKDHVRLQVNVGKDQHEERPKQIRVRITSNEEKISRQYNEDLTINVYPSTTIGDVRTAFEYSHEFPPSDQYFFVNGHLAHETSTMNDLDFQSNPLFVLFIIHR